MTLHLIRQLNQLPYLGRPGYCIGSLYADGAFVCHTLERPSYGLRASDKITQVMQVKAAHMCAIPAGRYSLDLDTVSPRFGHSPFYLDACGGRLPRLRNVPGWEGVLIHCGNRVQDTRGCIIVGQHIGPGLLAQSRIKFLELIAVLQVARIRNESEYIIIEEK